VQGVNKADETVKALIGDVRQKGNDVVQSAIGATNEVQKEVEKFIPKVTDELNNAAESVKNFFNKPWW